MAPPFGLPFFLNGGRLLFVGREVTSEGETLEENERKISDCDNLVRLLIVQMIGHFLLIGRNTYKKAPQTGREVSGMKGYLGNFVIRAAGSKSLRHIFLPPIFPD